MPWKRPAVKPRSGADRLRTQRNFSKAFNEVAKAFILDPLDTEIQSFEQQLQAEFDLFLAEEHARRLNEERAAIVARHLQHAEEMLERDLYEEALAEVNGGLAVDERNTTLLAS